MHGSTITYDYLHCQILTSLQEVLCAQDLSLLLAYCDKNLIYIYARIILCIKNEGSLDDWNKLQMLAFAKQRPPRSAEDYQIFSKVILQSPLNAKCNQYY